jgi:CPA2 family monovalent cation:H+ antiporter-2
VGLQVASVLARLSTSFVLVELDQHRVDQAKEEGYPIVYGDGSHEVVQEALAMRDASLLVVTTPGIVVAQAIVRHARQVNRRIRVVSRIADPAFFQIFKELGVTDLVYPEFEASLEITRQALLHLRIPAPEIQRQTEAMRHQLLAPQLAESEEYRTLGQMRAAEQCFDLQWVRLEGQNRLLGRSIGEAEIRRTTGASVVGIIRDGQLVPNPDVGFRFLPNDLVAIIGSTEAREQFHRFADGREANGSESAVPA